MSNSIQGYYQSILDKVPDVSPASSIGICGAHGTGKTTLAIALSKTLNIPYVSIDANSVFLQHGFSPSDKLDVRTRLFLQQKILEKAESIWLKTSQSFICDRTPIDMMAYMLAEIQGHTLDERTAQELYDYLVDCRMLLRRFFDNIVLIPPAIPIVDRIGKASSCPRYIEHIHLLCLGLFHESGINGYVLPDFVTNLIDRIENVKAFLGQ